MKQEQTNLSVRVNKEDKSEFEKFCNAVGMNVSVAVNMFIKAVLKDNKLPFEISCDPIYTEKSINRLKKSINNIDSGNKITKTIEELEELENE